MRNGYEQFFNSFPREDFFKFGLENIISGNQEIVSKKWDDLKKRINSKNENIYIRNFGRGGVQNENLSRLYSDVFGLNIVFDPTNNHGPRQLIQDMTGLLINKTIFNYQVAHVFGQTKNVFCFTAPWNVVFIPKIIDPLTGHEAVGGFVNDFRVVFKGLIYSKFKDQIEEYNSIIDGYIPDINSWIDINVTGISRRHYKNIFQKIETNAF